MYNGSLYSLVRLVIYSESKGVLLILEPFHRSLSLTYSLPTYSVYITESPKYIHLE